MWFYIKLAWRNVLRNKRRTIIAGSAIGVGLASLLFTAALMEGMKINMIHSSTSSFLGEAEIHGSDFRETQEVEKTVNNLDQVIADLKQESVVDKFTLRTLSMGMITSPSDANAVLLVGIIPGTEKYLSKIDDAIEKGAFFSGNNLNDIVIGSKLAEILAVALGDRIVVTVSQANTGDLSQEMFRVSGIYSYGITEMDTGMAFIRLPVSQRMLGIGDNVHQIAVKFNDIRIASMGNHFFWKKYSRYNNEAVGWPILLPQMKTVMDMTWISLLIVAVILMGLVTFGIINTLFMSFYERMFEFSILSAVGTRPGGLRKLIIFEAVSLAIIGIILGILLGLIITVIFKYAGIDYRGIEYAGTTFHELIYPVIHPLHYLIYPAGVFVFTILVGLYPAWVASRLRPAEGLRRSL
ncbi:MAG TPA: FtsX-like permease family protein [Candidatus Deferrimicrobium sp.]|nr:FtsX-like permease family protein [Candidatus Deferrimicrobium sp.]